MDFHVTRGFNPLNGLEILNAVCGHVRQELQKHDYLSQNLAYSGASWKVTIEINLAPSAHAQPDVHASVIQEAFEQINQDGTPTEPTGEILTKEPIEIEHTVEFPDLTREQFLDEKPAKEPESATVAVAPTRAAMESYPEKFGKRAR